MPSINQVFRLPPNTVLKERTHSSLITDDRVGVEIELEGMPYSREHIQAMVDSRWDVVSDGSLRNNGIEFVFAKPMFGTDVVETLQSLPDTFNSHDIEPSVTERCSIHVHLDVRDLEYEQLLSLVVVYLLCEPYFFAVGGEERRHNLYSMPLGESTDYLNRLGRALENNDMQRMRFNAHISPDVKYSAFNVAPVMSQGSVEFRHHRGTYDPATILHWINMTLALKRYVKALEGQRMTPEFIDNIVNGGYSEFIDTVFRGVHVPMEVDGWREAARVAKRVSTAATKGSLQYDIPMLPISELKNRFIKAQHKVGIDKISHYKKFIRGTLSSWGIDSFEEGDRIGAPAISGRSDSERNRDAQVDEYLSSLSPIQYPIGEE